MTHDDTASDETACLRIHLLGGFRVAVGVRGFDAEVWRLRKAAALVKLLALAPDHRLHREQVLHLLWPEHEPAAAGNNLRYALHVARRALDPDGSAGRRLLQFRGDWLALDAVWCDVEAFEDAVAAARRAQQPDRYQAALALYAGDLLPDDRYEDWAAAHRERLRALYLAVLSELSELYEHLGDRDSAAETLQRLLAAEPAHEQAHIALIRLLALAGRRHLALRQYHRLREALRHDPNVEPDHASQELYEAIRSGRFPAAPPDTHPATPRATDNLPVALSSFVGRVRELDEVRRLLTDARLVTLTGAGGSGKTRLAIEAAAGMVGHYADGVWLVELAALADPSLVPQSVAAALGLRERRGQPIVESVRDFLRARRSLLVLDNCEHLVGACAALANTLLRSCPGLNVLATSRERLGLTGEVVWRVPALSPPDAVRLLCERAAAVSPAFTITDTNARVVDEICRRLDCIPLALELAASRLAAMSVQEVAARLDGRFRLLAGGDPTALPRQRTLRATLDWSHDLLSEPERIVFRRLAVFTGGFELEAAEVVAAGAGIEPAEVAGLVARLVDTSLVVVDDQGVTVRYRLLETVQRYAEDQLDREGETHALRARHLAYYVELAERLQIATLGGPDHKCAMDRLEVEHDNLRAALAWAHDHGEAADELRLASSLGRFWEVGGHISEARRWLEAALARGADAPPVVHAWALNAAGRAALAEGTLRPATAYFNESLSIYRMFEDRLGVAIVRLGQGTLAILETDYDRAVACFEESLALFRDVNQPLGIAAALVDLGMAEYQRGNDARALALLQESLALFHQIGDRRGAASVTIEMGKAAQRRGDVAGARRYLEEGLALCRELGDRFGIAHALAQLGSVEQSGSAREQEATVSGIRISRLRLLARLDGDQDRAAALYREALVMYRQIGARVEMADCIEGLASAAAAAGRWERAMRLAAAAEALRESNGLPPSPAGHVALERSLTLARQEIGEAAAAAAWSAGRALSLDEAITEALSDTAGTSPAM